MERMKINVRIPSEVAAYEKKQLHMMLQSPFVLDYLKQHGMEEQDLVENLPFFLQLVEEIQECRRCTGLAFCVKKERGYVPTLKKIGFVQWVKTPCNYLKNTLVEREKIKYYHYKMLPGEQMNISFDRIDVMKETKQYQKVFASIVKWAQTPQIKGFYIFGAPGAGKSFLMLCLLNQMASEKKSVAFVNVLELISLNKPRIDFDMLYEIMDADFVVIDDIGAETVNAISRDEILFAVLDARMNRKKWTCFTSNFSMQELEIHFTKNQYGDEEAMKALRLMERIRALSTEVELHGKSRR